MSTFTKPIEQQIADVARERLGAVDASVMRVRQGGDREVASGEWFAVSIRLPGDNESQLLGRRRTKVELLALVSTLDPRHVNGKCFRG